MRKMSLLLLVVVGLQVLLVSPPVQRVDILGRVLTGPVLHFIYAVVATAILCKIRREKLGVLRWSRPFHLATGIVFGAATPAAVFLIGLACHSVAITPQAALPMGFSFLTIAFAFVAFGEEILWRGLVFRLLEHQWGFALAAVISSAAFGGMHMIPAGRSLGLFGLLNLILLGGVFCLLYRRAKTLWLPIGFHFSWNVTQVALSPLLTSTGSFLTRNTYFGVEGWPLSSLVLAVLVIALLPWGLTRYDKARRLSN